MTEIRTPTEDEREQIGSVMSISLNFGQAWAERRAPTFRLEQFLVAVDDGRVVATSAARPFLQWFGARALPMTGVYAVATLPEHRGGGLASELVTRLMRRGREEGALISALYPAAVRPYRGIGYEIAGTYTDHRIAISDLPQGPAPLRVEEYRTGDLDDVRAVFREVMSTQNGPIYSELEDWWTERILATREPDVLFRVAVVRGENRAIEGFCPFRYGKGGGGDFDFAFGIETAHLVARSEAALRSLLVYFRGFRGLGESLQWSGPPADPIALLIEEQKIKTAWTFHWMLRLLDVPGALEGRGYPPVSGSLDLMLRDPAFEEDDGATYHLEAESGKVRASRVERAASAVASIGTFSSIFTGFTSPADAVRVGALQADGAAVEFLSALFAGPPPWLPEWF
ncbi:MAG: enhanced intracellular survival protein Eis [Actinomycetota bacterium]